MIPAQPITFLNTGIPVMLMALLAWVVPVVLGRAAGSQQALTLGILVSTAILLVSGAILFAVAYSAGGVPVRNAFAVQPIGIGAFFLKTSLISGIIWGPVLALAWFVLAQGVERRKGVEQARRERT